MAFDVNERAWGLYRQINAQRAVLRSYGEALDFVRVRQAEAPATIEPVAKALWEIAERVRGDMNPSWPPRPRDYFNDMPEGV